MLTRSELFVHSEFGFNQQDLDELRLFLSSERERLQKTIKLPIDEMPEVHVVLGNESADLDSVVSAIVRAYHLFLIKENNNIYLPFINIFREELGLRRDVQYLLENLCIFADDLSFIDDQISLNFIYKLNKLNLHLVDHNELNPDQSHLSDVVIDIIDHHADAQRYPYLQEKIINVVGSCTTLVVNEFLKTQPVEEMPKAFAGLLLAPILMDTDNLLSKEKTTSEDLELKEILAARVGNKLPSNFYDKMRTKKEDIAGLTNKLRLLKDFKKFRSDEVVYGMSTLGSSMGFWFEHEAGLLQDFEEVTIKRELDFLVILMPYYNEGRHPQRKIVIYSKSPEILAAIDGFTREDEFLQKKVILEKESTNTCFYTSQDFMSRKELQPRINDISKNKMFMTCYWQVKQQELNIVDDLLDTRTKSSSSLRANSLFPGSSNVVIEEEAISVPTEPGSLKRTSRDFAFLSGANIDLSPCSSSSCLDDNSADEMHRSLHGLPPVPKQSRGV